MDQKNDTENLQNEPSVLSENPEESQLQIFDLNYFLNQNQEAQSTIMDLLFKLAAQVYEFFLELRNRIDDNLYMTLKTNLPLQETQEQICNKDIADVWKYVQVFVEGLLINREEIQQQLSQKVDQEVCEYEQQLQKLEAEIRNHIRIEQQLKLYFENTQQKLEEVEKQKEIDSEEYVQKIQELEQQLDSFRSQKDSKDLLIENLQKDCKNKDEAIRFLNERIKMLEQKSLVSTNVITKNQNLNQQQMPHKSSYTRAQTEASDGGTNFNQNTIPTEESIASDLTHSNNKMKYLPSNNNSLSRFKLQAHQQKFHHQQAQIQSQQNYNIVQNNSDLEFNTSNPNLYQYFQEKIMQRNDSKEGDINQIHKKLKKLQKILDRKPLDGLGIVQKGVVINNSNSVLNQQSMGIISGHQIVNNNSRNFQDSQQNGAVIPNHSVSSNSQSQQNMRNRSYTSTSNQQIEKRHSSQSRDRAHETTNSHQNGKGYLNNSTNNQQIIPNNNYVYQNSGNSTKTKNNLMQTVNLGNQNNQRNNSRGNEKGILEAKSTSQILSVQKQQLIQKKSSQQQLQNKYSPNKKRAPTPPVHSHTSRDAYSHDHQKSTVDSVSHPIPNSQSPKPNILQQQQIKKRNGNSSSSHYLTERNK